MIPRKDNGKTQFESQIKKYGNSYYMRIPPKIKEKLEGDHNTDLIIETEYDEYGPSISAWNPDQQKESDN